VVSRRGPPARCGVGDYAHALGQALAARGLEVSHRVGRERTLLAGAAAARAGGVVLLEYSPYDLDGPAHRRLGLTPGTSLCCLLARAVGVKLVTHLHELDADAGPGARSRMHAALQRACVAAIALASREIVVNTPERRQMIEARWPQKRGHVHYLANASNIPALAMTAAERAEFRRVRLDAAPNDVVVGTFATLQRGKELPRVVDAAAAAGARLALIGDLVTQRSPLYRELADAIASAGTTAVWSGYVPADECSRWLASLDIYVQSQPDGDLTRSGGFMAAAAHGLPVVARRAGALPPELTPGEHVVVVPPDDPTALAAATKRLARDPGERVRLGTALRARYHECFDWPQAAARMAEILAR
jgi:glycosyltransferase involved in cell wall biosynthesis